MRGLTCEGIGAAVVLAGLLGAAAQAQEAPPLSVTYGLKASTAEGDPDYREIMFLSVPDTLRDQLYLRVFDPDTGGDHDLIYGAAADSETRFTLFGGKGAYSGALSSGGLELTPDELNAGERLVERSYGENATFDGAWVTLASISPEQGERQDGRLLFRLLIQGTAGDDANLYSVTLSLRDRRNLAPDGLEIFSFAPTVRVPNDRTITELRFTAPPDADRLVVRNFDAARADIQLTTGFRSIPIAASGQNEWREAEVALQADERGEPAAIVFRGGDEQPNDVTFEVLAAGKPVPIELPARAGRPNARPLPEADVAPLADCSSVAFDASRSSDPDGDQLTYAWAFGDGATGAGRALVHRYPGPGSYQAVLRAVDSSGRVGNGAQRSFDVFLKRPPTALAGQDEVVAPGEEVVFDGSGSRAGDRPIARYLWDFYDGASSEGRTTSHAFAKPGRYVVTLRVEDDSSPPCNAGADQKIVRVNFPPVAVAGENLQTTVGETVRLDAGRSYDVDGKITAYRWDLGDGSAQEGALVEHAFKAPGTYEVKLEVQDDAGVANSAGADSLQVVVNAPPVAEAGPDRKVATGEVVTFDGSASSDPDGALIQYAWDFGDGSGGSGSTVSYAYPRPGTYLVTLTVRDDSATDSSTGSDGLTVVVNAPPVADAGPDQVVSSSEVRFDGSASRDPDGALARYDWDFGDGAAGSGAAPTHVYRTPGTYLVRLTVTDDSGTIRSTASDALRVVVNAAPIADAGPDLVGAPGQKLTFMAAGSIDPDGDVSDYLWEFKDGASGSGRQVAHAFEKPGTYQVRLSVGDDTNQAAAIDYDEAKVVINAPPVAKAGPDILAGPGDAVRFDAGASSDLDGQIASYRWDFSDQPEPSTGKEVVRAYASPGVYTAQLTVTDDSGAINAVDQDEVTIRINHAPVASAGGDVVTYENTLAFDGSGSADADGDALTYQWDFGDGTPPAGGVRVSHTYAEGGIYPVVLTVDDGTALWNAKSTAAIRVSINRPPVAVAGTNKDVCAGDVVVFDGSGSHDPDGGLLRYHWDFGDGTGADIVNPTKTYKIGKLYPVTLTVQDESGFPNDRHTDRIVVKVDESPIAEAGADQTVCTGVEVHFDGSKSTDFDGVVNRFTWNFGDERTGGGITPVHVYTQPGDYRVLLNIEGDQAGQCDNTDTDELVVHVVEAPVARIAGPSRVATGVAAAFDASGSSNATGKIVGWHWDFGDGAMADGAKVVHQFDKPGAYVVKLAIDTEANGSACQAVAAEHYVVANAPPVADAGRERLVGVNEDVAFDASGSSDPDGAILAYDWDFGDGASATGLYVRHRFAQSGRYPVKLTVRDDTDLPNNSATATAMITVNAAPEPVIGAPDAACPGEQLAFSAADSRDADGAIKSYAWHFGDGASAEGAKVSHAFTAPGRYDLTLAVDDGTERNNSLQQITKSFHVNRPPRALAGPDRMVCPGDPVAFDGGASVDWDGKLVDYTWDFGDGTTANGAKVVHPFETPGLYDVRLSVSDDSGSSCRTQTDVVKVQVNAPPVAVADGDRQGFTGGAYDQLLFDASASSDADGEPLSYVWDLGDGVQLAGEKILHGYAEPGEYDVKLGVSDGSGLVCGQAWTDLKVAVKRRE